MILELTYGDGTIPIEIPDGVEVDEFAPVRVAQPVTFDHFSDEFRKSGGVEFVSDNPPLIVVNDAYRNTPTPEILGWLDRIKDDLLDTADFIVATGTHDPPTESQLVSIFGPHLERVRRHLLVHNAVDYDSMTQLGVDSMGGEVWLNNALDNHQRLLLISSVEPHYFAGLSGGRKSLFPGLTDLATIERNHNLANSMLAEPLALEGNPVAEHLEELAGFVDQSRLLGIQAVLDADGAIASLFCGGLNESFGRGRKRAEDIFAHRIEQQYDVVICELRSPLDKNLYQVQKALEHCHAGVRNGGAIILVSACREGIGSEHFMQLAQKWDCTKNEPADGKWRFGSHKLSRVAAHSQRIEVYLHSTLPPQPVRQVFYEPLDFVKKFLFLRSDQRELFRLAVVRDAGNSVLTV
ncbi:MAG: lactate racemase domain-containing protein [candidate division Zixibacteria bacterium]|nr:lactate racemase domain-containing protein [candidate division Zixibacteria bacterium]MDH3937936.1 lactate racemase domain-containing protein [candidate division Zixibacteria bacterium]MDH4033445.1 lactate racemase domain-containing protein [candidate division Zixibacteria bacterium]